MSILYFETNGLTGSGQTSVCVESLIIAGWAGRNAADVKAHIDELAEIGVPPPRQVPTFYRLGAHLLTTADDIQVVGNGSTGEVEAVLFAIDGRQWVGVGSDHTDRTLERTSVTASKQVCPKPVGRQLWPFEDVATHWDELILRSFIEENGDYVAYQIGQMKQLRHPGDLIAGYQNGAARLADGAAMYCGTVPTIGAARWSPSFRVELIDPVRNRSIAHSYRIVSLPLAD
jgi:hypothetical protein